MRSFRLVLLSGLLTGVGWLSLGTSALASGFALTEHSVVNMGTAASGGAAGLDDLSTIYYNPAGLMRLPGGGAVIGAGHVIFSQAKFKDQGSAIVPGLPTSGGNGGNAAGVSVIPNLYAAYGVSDRLKVGLGVTVPFGLSTKYDEDWVGRYQAVDSELITVNVNPTVAYRLSDSLSIGAGINGQYARAELTNAIDFGGVLASRGAPIGPQQADGFVDISGDDWSWGYNLGVLYEPSESTRVGITYRSSITHTLKGDADFTVPGVATPLTATGRFTDSDATAKLNLPDAIALGVYQQITPKLSLTGDLTWTNWSDFEELRIQFDSAQPDTVVPENWNDTLRVALGVTYNLNDQWTLRSGVAYDPTPVEREFLTPRIPDSDRTWLSFGASYAPSDNFTLDVAYTHIFVDDRGIVSTVPGQGTLVGDYDSSVDIISAQLNWKF